MADDDFTYECIKCKSRIVTWASPKDYRIATGKSVSCCGEAMQLIDCKVV